jgi:hypothetical protein
LGKGMALTFFRISDSTPGAILQPQPPPWERLVRRGSGAAPPGELGLEVVIVWLFSLELPSPHSILTTIASIEPFN